MDGAYPSAVPAVPPLGATPMRSGFHAALIVAAAMAAAMASGASAQVTRQFGAATFSPPPGWTFDAGPTRQTMTLIRGGDLCIALVYRDEASPPDLRAAFADAWQNVFSSRGYRSAPSPTPADQVSPAGYRHLAGENEVIDNGGNRFIGRLHVFPAGARTQTVVLIGNSRNALATCRPDWDAFFASLRFPSATRVAANTTQAEKPAVAARDSVVRQPAPAVAREGGPMTFDNVTFTPPAGWSVERTPGGINLKPMDTRGAESLQVTLLPGRRSSATLEQEFSATWSELLSSLKAQPMLTVNRVPYDLDEPGRSPRGWDWLRGSGGMRQAGGFWAVDLYVIRAGDRMERVAVFATDFRDNLSMTNASLNPRYARAIQRLVFTLQFANVPPVPVAPVTLRGAGITGVWAGLALSFGRIKRHIAIFFDDGTAYFGPFFPQPGLLEIDPSIEQPRARRYWGTWVFRNGAGTLTLPWGTIPLQATNPSLKLTVNQQDHSYIRTFTPDAAQLEGTWCLDDPHCIRFGADGRFEDSGAVRVLEHATYPFPESPPRGSGRYEVREYTLILRYDGGPELRLGLAGVTDRTARPRELMAGYELDVLQRR